MDAPQRSLRVGLLFCSPWLIGGALLVLWPFAASFYWSFCEYDLLSKPRFVGAVHYRRLVSELAAGEGFGLALWNTAYYALFSVPASIALGVGLALMLQWRVRGRAFLRALVFLPSVVPIVAASVLWMWMLDPNDGVVNYLLSWIYIPEQSWFNGRGEALLGGGFGSKDALVLMALWGVGNYVIIYLAALNDVPQHLYEAAEIDGANRWASFRHVTAPMLTPVIFFNLVMGLIQSVQAFTQVYVVSAGRGEPQGSTLVLSLHLFLSAFQDLDMGYASAMAWLLFVVLLVVTIALFRSARHWVHYQGALR